MSLLSIFWRKKNTKKESADNYINKLDSQVRDNMVEVSTNLIRLQSEIQQFKDTIDNISNISNQFQPQKKI